MEVIGHMGKLDLYRFRPLRFAAVKGVFDVYCLYLVGLESDALGLNKTGSTRYDCAL